MNPAPDFFSDPSHVWIALLIGLISFISAIFVFTAIILVVFKRHEAVEEKLYLSILDEAKKIVEPAARYVGGIARQYDAIRKVLKEHDARLRKLEGPNAPPRVAPSVLDE